MNISTLQAISGYGMTAGPKPDATNAVAGAADLLMIQDASATGQQMRRITVNNFRDALNIPSGSTDELVAVVSGATSCCGAERESASRACGASSSACAYGVF